MARVALDVEVVELVLPYVHESGEPEVRSAFERVVKARAQGDEAREVADQYFFETVVRVHRAGEGAPFTGLQPAGLDVGPAIPVAEAAIEAGSAEGLATFLADAVRREATKRFETMLAAKASAGDGVAAARTYVEAMLGIQVWAHKLFRAIHANTHEGDSHEHGGRPSETGTSSRASSGS